MLAPFPPWFLHYSPLYSIQIDFLMNSCLFPPLPGKQITICPLNLWSQQSSNGLGRPKGPSSLRLDEGPGQVRTHRCDAKTPEQHCPVPRSTDGINSVPCSTLYLPQLQLPVGALTPHSLLGETVFYCFYLLEVFPMQIAPLWENPVRQLQACSLFGRFLNLRAAAKTQPFCQTSLKRERERKKSGVYCLLWIFYCSQRCLSSIASTPAVGRGLFLTAQLHLTYALSLFFSDFLCNPEDFSH